MNGTQKEWMTEAQTILAQLGGRRFQIMTGVAVLFGQTAEGRTEVTLKLPRRAAFRIVLRNDLYDLEHFKMTAYPACEIITLNAAEGVYADMLVDIFERWTGLRASL